MAKHPHRLMLRDKKTWCCMLPGCSYFIHRGLEHTLPGKTIICWECAEQFMCDEGTIKDALLDDMPKCAMCRARARGADIDNIGKWLEEKGLADRPVGLAAFGAVSPKRFELVKAEEVDQVEVIPEDETHSADCQVYEGGDCTCKV
jgi:hypothetical protein